MHGNARNKKLSEYGLQLREKQKAKRYYGVLDSQFHDYYEMANTCCPSWRPVWTTWSIAWASP